MNKETFEAYLNLESIVELMTNINYRHKEKKVIEKYKKELILKMNDFKERLKSFKDNLLVIQQRRQQLYIQITNIDSLYEKNDSLIQKRNLLYDEYRECTRELYDSTQNYNKIAETFNKMNSELNQTKLDIVTRNDDLNERIELGKYIYDYCTTNRKFLAIRNTMKKMDENGIFSKQNTEIIEETSKTK